MKIREIDAEKFNNLLKAEPDATIYQSSYYADFEVSNGYKALFLEGFDEAGSCDALGMFLLKKNSLFSNKMTAYAPHGYLVNFYDDERFEDFHKLLVQYFASHNVSRFIIEPKVEKHSEMVLDKLNELSYRKSAERKTYIVDVTDFSELKTDSDIIVRINSSDDFNTTADLLERKEKEEQKKRFSYLKENSLIYTAKIDSFKTQRALKESIEECETFIREHLEDYKFQDKIKEKEDELSEIKKKLATLLKFEKQSGSDPLIAVEAVSYYGDNCSILFYANRDESNIFELDKVLLNAIAEDCRSRFVDSIEYEKPFSVAKEVELVGEYTCDV